MSPLATVFVMQSQTQRRFNDATSAEKAAKCGGSRSGHGIAANPRTTRRVKV